MKSHVNYSVYIHKFPNGKVYIGITSIDPINRWGVKGNGYYNQPLMYRAIRKYSWDNIEHKVLFSGLVKEEAEQLEIELIKKYKSNLKEFGYNIANGGNTIGMHSEETKRKISEGHKGKKCSIKHRRALSKSRLGRKMSKETKEKMSKSKLGYKHRKESIAKMKLSQKKRFSNRENCPLYGKYGSEHNRSKKVAQIKENTTVAIYGSTREAERETGVYHTSISKACLGKQKHAGGYEWKYI